MEEFSWVPRLRLVETLANKMLTEQSSILRQFRLYIYYKYRLHIICMTYHGMHIRCMIMYDVIHI